MRRLQISVLLSTEADVDDRSQWRLLLHTRLSLNAETCMFITVIRLVVNEKTYSDVGDPSGNNLVQLRGEDQFPVQVVQGPEKDCYSLNISFQQLTMRTESLQVCVLKKYPCECKCVAVICVHESYERSSLFLLGVFGFNQASDER